LRGALEEILSRRTTAEWMESLAAAGIACGPVLGLDEALADPQARHLRLTRKVEHPQAGELELLRHPVTLSETPTGIRVPPPVPGSSTRAILEEQGFTESEIEELLADGVAFTES
jgi:crotonobetainyl-CoA:carnitine CoA-transferase CaiB-like acyl-CoA transferase